MRIISILVAVPMLWTMLFPQNVIAADVANTNETNTKFKIQENIAIINGVVSLNTNILANAPYNIEKIEPAPVVSKGEAERDAKLAKRYGEKLAKAVYPKGKFIVNASAYTAAADECGKSDGITASGLQVMEKRTLACPPQFPLGTKIKIHGMGSYVCEDRGGAIKGNHVDIYMQTKKEAFAFGRRNLTAEVIQ